MKGDNQESTASRTRSLLMKKFLKEKVSSEPFSKNP